MNAIAVYHVSLAESVKDLAKMCKMLCGTFASNEEVTDVAIAEW